MAKKHKLGKTFWILFFILIMSMIVVLLIFTQKSQQPSQKDAKNYFQILNATVFGTFIPDEETLLIQILSFSLKAIGGDATYGWVIPGEGNVDPRLWPRFNLTQGESKPINIYYYQRPPVERTPEGFYQLHVQIDCYEAYGTIIINATRPEEK